MSLGTGAAWNPSPRGGVLRGGRPVLRHLVVPADLGTQTAMSLAAMSTTLAHRPIRQICSSHVHRADPQRTPARSCHDLSRAQGRPGLAAIRPRGGCVTDRNRRLPLESGKLAALHARPWRCGSRRIHPSSGAFTRSLRHHTSSTSTGFGQRPRPPLTGTDPRFAYCCQAVPAGYGPNIRGRDPEYAWYTDGDGDGRVCE